MQTEAFGGTAYSYIRFSSKEQELGDSIRRQRGLRDRWLEINPQVTLDTTLGGEDRGVSGFRGTNRSDKHHLGRFLEAVRRGRVVPGSVLLLESLDRLSREEEEESLALLLGLMNSGIIIVQLQPYTVIRKGDGMMGLMRALIFLSRAHEESATKSSRVSKAWSNLQNEAITTGKIVTARCPGWLEIHDGKFRFKPGALATIRRIYLECTQGRGARMIASDLDREKVPHFTGGRWQSTYTTMILNKRETMGEYQAFHKVNGKRVKNGPPVADYFPPAVSAVEWAAAQKAIKSRKRMGGRRGTEGWVALFSSVFDARTGERLQAIRRHQNGRHYRVLQQAGVAARQEVCRAFPLDSFEGAVLGELVELNIDDIMPPTEDGGRVATLSKELADAETRLSRLQSAMIEGDEAGAALPVLRELDRRRESLVKELTSAQQDAASPVHEQWGTLKGLATAAATDPEARIRLRAAAHRLIERINVLIVPVGKEVRFAVVQVHFRDSVRVRHYMIRHQRANNGPKKTKVPSKWDLISNAWPATAGELDLRDPAHVKRLERALADADTRHAN